MNINLTNTPNLFSSLNQYENRIVSNDFPLSQDKVSLSHRATTLSSISQTYFSGTISSSNIPALSQALYEGGFITDEEFVSLGGNLNGNEISTTSQANNFLNRYMSSGADISNQDRASLEDVIEVISGMDQYPDANQLLKEQQALSFIQSFQSELDSADQDVKDGFQLVSDILHSLEKIRNGEVDPNMTTDG